MIRYFFILVVSTSFMVQAEEMKPLISEKGDLVMSETFQKDSLAPKWRTQFGEWKPVDGVLRARQVAADNHAAAARYLLPMGDGIFQFRFRLVEKGKGFHFGFDPARGTLDKKGHLFSLIVSPTKAKLTKHLDKNKPKEDPNEDLATSGTKFKPGGWHSVLLEKKGNDVAIQIQPENGEGMIALKGSHPTFHVKTPTLVFRCIGDGIEIDDITVWNMEE